METALPSILCGRWRYAHINAVRGDGVNPGLPEDAHLLLSG
jgi:hypothetical protein